MWMLCGENVLNSLAPGRCLSNLKSTIFKLIILNSSMDIHCEIAFRWMQDYLTNEQSTLVQVIAWCHQTTSHYQSQSWPRSLLPYGITRQWDNSFSALLAICAGNSPDPFGFPTQRPVTRSFDVFFDLCLNKRLSKQWWGWWFEMPPCPLWRHHNVNRGWWVKSVVKTIDLPQSFESQQNLCVYTHDDIMTWKHFPHYSLFVNGIHWSLVESPTKGQWYGAMMFPVIMMTSSNGNIFRFTGHLCGEFGSPRWIPGTKAELWCFLWSASEKGLSKWSWGWWFETLSSLLWLHRNDVTLNKLLDKQFQE